MRRLVIAVLAAVACFVAATPSVAHAATPCWERVIQDWTKDGRIDGTYSPHCLRQAIKNTPEDLRDYSSIVDDINAALLGPPGSSAGNGSGSSGGGGGGGNTGGTSGNAAGPKAEEAQQRAEKVVPKAGTPGSIPDSSRSLPLPLLILASVALAALLAAASPALIHRVRARFPRGPAAPQPDR
jgi:hypothetical protein